MSNCKDCSEATCNTCNDDYYLESNTCKKCDISCELKCTGAGPTKCTDNKCKVNGYYFDGIETCKSCEIVLANCY